MNKTVSRPGRPRALSGEIQAKLIEGIRSGLFLTTACRAAGITPSCFYHWRRKDRDRHPDATEYREFFHTIKRASAQAEVDALERVLSGDGQSWRASSWFLERRFRERWGKKSRVNVQGGPR